MMAKMAGLWGVLLILSSLSFADSSGVPATPTNLTVVSQVPSADHGIIATLTWTVSPSNTALRYYVRYHEQKKQHYTQKMTTATNARIFLQPNSYYEVKVMAIDPQASTQGKWSEDLKVKTGDSVPTHAPVNVTAAAVTSSSILVRWQAIPQEDRNGKLFGYVLFYRRQNYRRWKTKILKSPLIFQSHMTGLALGESYLIAVAGFTKIGVGKKSDAVTVNLPTKEKSRSTSTRRPAVTTVAYVQETTALPCTTAKSLPTTPKYFNNHIPKETPPRNKLVTYERPSGSQRVQETTHSTVVSPNAQANKDIPDEKSSSVGLVYKFIIPSAIGGLIMVMLIICILWRHRKSKRKHPSGDESLSLTPLSERNKKDKTRCAVTRGEGSIRYAPPTKTYTTSAPPPQDADPQDETRTTLSVISENESNTLNRALPAKPRQPYAEISIVGNDVKDERYVKRNEHKPIPSSPCKSTSSESGYENMQHLFKTLPDNKGSPLYVNVNQDEEVLYEEIPADLKNRVGLAVQQPLLAKNDEKEVKPVAV